MAAAVMACVADNTRVELYPITDVGVGRPPFFVATAPGATATNTSWLRIQVERDQFVTAAAAAADSVVNTRRTYDGFDPLGTLFAAGEALHRGSTSAKQIVIVIGNGWQQSKRVNLFRYNDVASKHADEVIQQLRGDQILPNLAGTDVAFAGVVRGDKRMKVGDREIVGLRIFWDRIVRASGGTLVSFDPVLPGFTAPL
jgi:hypothetical protein